MSTLVSLQSEVMKPFARARGIALIEHIEPNIFLLGDLNQGKRLLTNLIKNAIDYNRERGTITVSLTQKDERVVLTVSDTGIGIASEDQKHVFERFYKSDKARSRETGGAGLGLSIVAEIVRSHEGKIEMESQINAGTTFRIIFPAA